MWKEYRYFVKQKQNIMLSSKSKSLPLFTRGSSDAGLVLHSNALSIREVRHLFFDVVIIECGGRIEIVEGIRASAILIKAATNEFKGEIHWPILKDGKVVSKKKTLDYYLAVLEDEQGNLVLKKQEDAIPIINGIVPEGFSIVFIPPQKKRKK